MEALILLFIVLVFGFFSFPLYSYFALIAVYSFTFFDVGITFWSIFIVLGAVFLIPSLRLKIISSVLEISLNLNEGIKNTTPKTINNDQKVIPTSKNVKE